MQRIRKSSRSPCLFFFFFFFFSTHAVSLPKAAGSKVFNKELELEPRQQAGAENFRFFAFLS
jgi:hypothetical protein